MKALISEVEQLIESLHTKSQDKNRPEVQEPRTEARVSESKRQERETQAQPSRSRARFTPIQKAFIHSEIFRRKF